jgi:hypothetical protein
LTQKLSERQLCHPDMATGCDGRKLLISTGVSAALESGKSLAFYARPGGLELGLESAFAP